jgi:hypothetical protein
MPAIGMRPTYWRNSLRSRTTAAIRPAARCWSRIHESFRAEAAKQQRPRQASGGTRVVKHLPGQDKAGCRRVRAMI